MGMIAIQKQRLDPEKKVYKLVIQIFGERFVIRDMEGWNKIVAEKWHEN